ncbi:MAG: OmpA family protein [Spirochaetes bacterium]|nr:OmpA family protein [Spirochaetota bacterium]MBX3723820.1 OmpA family protein [Turneriella sp.]
MKLRKLMFVQAVMLAAIFAACSSTPKTEDRAPSNNMVVDAANAQLAKVPIMGFPGFGTTIPMNQFDQYGEASLTAAKGVLASMPAGYKLQIAGHANTTSGKSAEFLKNISTQRAKFVHGYFVKKGLDPAKMTYVGVSDSDQDPSLTKMQNRRVTFKLVEAK